MIPLHDENPAGSFPVVTVALIAVNTAVFAVLLLLPRWGLTPEGFVARVGMVPCEVTHRVDLPPHDLVPWWATPLTSMFVHGGWAHLVFNMLYLWIFGDNVEGLLGRARFLAFYLVCGLFAAAAQVLVGVDSTTPVIGASGAVAGLLGAYIVRWPRARVTTVFVLVFVFPVVQLPAWVLLGAWFALQAMGGSAILGGAGDVAYFAHIGGFVAGMLSVWVFAATRKRR
ncbi:MAG TPA: rhomboid family intramembrane serine protease [Thermoleophilia bacterium]|nr:rhomboid family intramembrane serine protease [Thermoleophilia bacterium]HQG02775.1 rhomboid family intramembrane serine protease [Thermoleophilia bacterium]HQG54074.1 rhomboid family intramembrane serine protease [Thermoleophilia bacterium]